MAMYPDLIPCANSTTCKAQVRPDDMAAHMQWHASINQNFGAIKVLLPGLSIAAL